MTQRPRREPPAVDLADMTLEDEWVTVALETDPETMANLGGALTEEAARAAHRRRVAGLGDRAWMLMIRPAGGGAPVGSVGVWATEWEGRPISEAGWMILREHHGKGYASAGLAALLARAKADGRWSDIHAFPGVENAASNALCRRFGFELIGEEAGAYAGRELRVNHWVLRADAQHEG